MYSATCLLRSRYLSYYTMFSAACFPCQAKCVEMVALTYHRCFIKVELKGGHTLCHSWNTGRLQLCLHWSYRSLSFRSVTPAGISRGGLLTVHQPGTRVKDRLGTTLISEHSRGFEPGIIYDRTTNEGLDLQQKLTPGTTAPVSSRWVAGICNISRIHRSLLKR